MTIIRETKKCWIIEEDGKSKKHGTFDSWPIVYRILFFKKYFPGREAIENIAEDGVISDRINYCVGVNYRRFKGVRVLEYREIRPDQDVKRKKKKGRRLC